MAYNALWALTNVAGCPKGLGAADLLLDRDVGTWLLKFLEALPTRASITPGADTPSPELIEQAIWCVGNVAGDSNAARDVLVNMGIFGLVLGKLRQQATTEPDITVL